MKNLPPSVDSTWVA